MGLITDFEKIEAGRELRDTDLRIRNMIEQLITLMNNFKNMKSKYVENATEIQPLLEYYKTRFDDIIKAF
jgi:hypothetical protein